jgi:hypothetical protein
MSYTRQLFLLRYYELITPILYNLIINNTRGNHNIYLCREGKKWYNIIENFESSLQ